MSTTMQFGWVDSPEEVEKHLPCLRIPEFKAAAPPAQENKEVLLYEVVRAALGKDAPAGPQQIGDCVSWGWGNLVNYIAALQIFQELKSQNLLFIPPDLTEQELKVITEARAMVTREYQECATESIYGFSRVEIGGQRGSYSDGSTGIWGSRAVTELGTLSRPYLESKGLGGAYNPNRAKDWGAKGVPDDLEPQARQHLIKTTSRVKSYTEAVAAIQNGYPVAVCSNRGFTTTRDSQGFCRPMGVWNHCMLFVANRIDRPGLCCSQSWGPNMPDGPLDKNQPTNTFWVDAQVVDSMLAQGDSYTGGPFMDYPIQDLISWRH